jgi:hypothetical protein
MAYCSLCQWCLLHSIHLVLYGCMHKLGRTLPILLLGPPLTADLILLWSYFFSLPSWFFQ